MLTPSTVFVQATPSDRPSPAFPTGGGWSAGASLVDLEQLGDGGLRVALRSSGDVSRVLLRWDVPIPAQLLVAGDAWERSYGELGWQHLRPERVLPWYWIGHDQVSGQTIGAGVDVRPAALCSWLVDRSGVTLCLDVRNGGSGVRPGDRSVELATVRAIRGDGDVWSMQRQLIDLMMTGRPRPEHRPVVGANNWYYAYGVGFDPDAVLTDARTVVELSDGHPVRPFSVIDDGWNPGGPGSGGPWNGGTPGLFDDMAGIAAEISAIGARPGLWFRPLRSRDEADRGLALARPDDRDDGIALDPSRPAVLERVADDLRRFRGWGFELIKHDFSSYDIFGRFGPAMGAELTVDGWSFADRSRTTAEIINDFYDVIRTATADAVLLGCNTVNHLAASVVDLQRTGDDTSGRDWERTRLMGINTLAHRFGQHRRFFTLDADCVPCTNAVPWRLNRQFLDLVARSGTALFVSVDPAARTDAADADLARAIAIALDGGAVPEQPDAVEARDGLWASTPVDWRFGDEQVSYDWSDEAGAWPLT